MARGQQLKNCARLNFRNPSLSPLSKGGIKGVSGRLGSYFLLNSKGISVLFLVMALLLMITIGYVLTYLIPTKQKSVKFPIYSNQAFFISQSGVEYAIRYAADQGWRGATDTGVYDLTRLNGVGVNQRNLGNGSFTINYTSATNILTSTGQITGSSESRLVRVSNFSPFLRLVFTTPAPQWTLGTRRARFYIINVRVSNVTLRSFSASWTAQNNRTISAIYFNGTAAANRRYAGAYVNGSPAVTFNRNGNSYTISPTPPSAATSVYIYWSGNLGTNSNITITFYTGNLGTGDAYTFDLDSAGNGL
jgi:phage shock protein PspC (stress-responsive transcriptional regulator)